MRCISCRSNGKFGARLRPRPSYSRSVISGWSRRAACLSSRRSADSSSIRCSSTIRCSAWVGLPGSRTLAANSCSVVNALLRSRMESSLAPSSRLPRRTRTPPARHAPARSPAARRDAPPVPQNAGHGRLGALDDGADLLPDELGVVAGRVRVAADDGAELTQSGRGKCGVRRRGVRADAVGEDVAQQHEGREVDGVRGSFQVGGRDQTAVDALREAFQVGAAGDEQRALAAARAAVGRCRCGGRSVAPVGAVDELTSPVTQQVVDGDGRLAAAGRSGKQHRRLAAQQSSLFLGQEQVELQAVRLLGGQQAAPLLVIDHLPALRTGVAPRGRPAWSDPACTRAVARTAHRSVRRSGRPRSGPGADRRDRPGSPGTARWRE